MKKLIYCAAALATLLFAGSCQRENLEPVGGPVTFTVTAPGDLDTRAYADGENVNEVHWAVYKTYEAPNALDGTDGPLAQGVVPMANKKATVELDLLQDQDYTILFWAQVKDAGHYNIGDLREVSVVYNPLYGNDESRAAFFVRHDFSTETKQNYDVTLVRPFAQINLGTTEASLSPVQEGQTQGYTIDVQQSEMTVKGLAATFDLVNGQGKDESVPFTFTSTPTPAKNGQALAVNGSNYHYVAMNYLLVPVQEKTVEVSYKITTDKGVIENTIGSVPVKENYRTNIIGNLLTSKTEFEIVVDENFNEPDVPVVSDGWAHVSGYDYTVNGDASEDALAQILAHANAAAKAATKAEGPVVTIDLNGDVYWKTEGGHGSSPLLPATSKISKVVINGNGNTFTATGAGVGSIRLANGGLLEFNKVNVVDKSVSYNESAWELTYLEFAGNLAFNGCTFNSGVQFQTEDNDVTLAASFANCRFISNEDSVYAVWISDGTTTFTGCSFEGTRGLKVHEEYGSEVVEIVVDGCWFGPLSKKPGVAIGTVNGDTKITIKNSKFSGCQAGDQGEYIYETDTDVDGILVLENNEVFGTQSDMLKSTLENATAGATVEVPVGEYTFPASSIKEGMTLKCAEGTVFQGASSLNIKGATVEGATFSNAAGTVVTSTINGTFKDCVFEGSNALRWAYTGETCVFENCVFSGDVYGIHFDGGAKNAIFRNCVISGFNAIAGDITSTFEGCTFKSNGKSSYNGINLWGAATMVNTEFEFDGSAANEWVDCIASDKSYSFTGCTINGGSALNPDYIWSRTAGTKIVFDGVEYIYKEGEYLASSSAAIVTNADAFKAALAANEAKIVLMPGIYEGTFAPKYAAIVESASATEKAVLKGRVDIDSYGDGVSFKNVKFEINNDSQVKNVFTGSNYKYPAIVNIYAAAVNFDGCDFVTDIAKGVCGINYGSHAPDKMLTVNACTFTGDFYAIRSRTLFSITNSKFDIYTDQGVLAAVFTWGNGEAGTQGNSGADSVTFTGNENLNANLIRGVQLSSTTFNYCHINFNVQDNDNFMAFKDSVNPACDFTGCTFADGSEIFPF